MSRKHSRAARRKRISGAATAGRKPLSAQVSEREARLLRELEAERLENLRLRQTIDTLQQASAPPAKDANELVPVRKKPRTRQEEWDASFREESRTAHGFSRRSYPRYLFDIVNASSPMRLIKKITLFFRRMRLVRLMGLDEGDSIADIRKATMRDNAEQMGKQFLLSDREVEVLALHALGWTQKRVAEELYISPSTAHAHIKRIYAKTGLHSRQEILDFMDQYTS